MSLASLLSTAGACHSSAYRLSSDKRRTCERRGYCGLPQRRSPGCRPSTTPRFAQMPVALKCWRGSCLLVPFLCTWCHSKSHVVWSFRLLLPSMAHVGRPRSKRSSELQITRGARQITYSLSTLVEKLETFFINCFRIERGMRRQKQCAAHR